MPQNFDSFTHEIDHAIAKKHGGLTVAGNLVLACFPCNNRKGPNIAGIDLDTKKLTSLFNPRRQDSTVAISDGEGPNSLGKQPSDVSRPRCWKSTLLNRVLIRQTLIEEGVFPPKEPG